MDKSYRKGNNLSSDSQNDSGKDLENAGSSSVDFDGTQTGGYASINQKYISQLVFLFGLVYFSQGFTGTQGIISQPLNYYFKDGLRLEADVVTEYLAILTIPWLIKPIYGLITDYFPFLGYRRKSWLMIVNFAACVGFLTVSGAEHPIFIIMALTLTSIGVAASDVITDEITVEKGRRHNCIGKFQSTQWCWLNIAVLLTSLFGGYLCDILEPAASLHMASLFAMATPVLVIIFTGTILKENRFQINLKQTRITTNHLVQSLKSKSLWIIALYIAFWSFSPAFGLPLYYHMRDNLNFTTGFIGQLAAFQSGGAILGALIHNRLMTRLTLKNQLIIAIGIGTLSHLSYLFICAPGENVGVLAITISIIVGIADMIGSLAIYTLAARACARRVEGFTFAALMSIYNGAFQIGVIFGSKLYVHTFAKSLAPLIWVSSAFTLVCIILVPVLNAQVGDRLKKED